jgi:hypothetical protein
MPSSRVRSETAESDTLPPRRSPSMFAIGESRRGISRVGTLPGLRRKLSIHATSGLRSITWRKM